MLQSILNKNRSGLMGALLIFAFILSFSACKEEDSFYTDYKAKNEEQLQEYFKAKGIDPGTLVKTRSGLYYQKLEEGTGVNVFRGDSVAVNYTGILLDGNEFDSSYKRGKPLKLKVGIGGVIPGWDEGLQLMKEGEKARLFIPSHLGYGRQPVQGIPANSVLVFDMVIEDVW
ncbi:FKBP-type peptidyl-prolyl cis-trans isomerase [Pontibacter akesuensis]|uniref:FKBP-type peptidyl-prolyl cis-trans isomerase n=1 Tax=Pontibacter akesuensis TaxID=388950 RepID=UPI00083A7BF5|nr:FKBP-type peptidyl-prolyl cis-trans isomerase [Pontibacter akesuensis]GHA69055.1 hypothetical protein GCM10007389_22650 [Pontibacter akesuensis]